MGKLSQIAAGFLLLTLPVAPIATGVPAAQPQTLTDSPALPPTFNIGGRIIPAPGSTFMPATVLLRSMEQAPGTGTPTPVHTDGTFEFSGIACCEYDLTVVDSAHPYPLLLVSPSGEYATIDSNSGIAATRNFTFRNQDVAGLELKLPIGVPGRAVVGTDGSAPPNGVIVSAASNASMGNARSSPGASSRVLAQGDGRFTLPVFAGDNTVSMSRVPPGYAVRSITYGALNLKTSPLKLDSAPAESILITLERIATP